MLPTLKDLFDTFTASVGNPSSREREHTLQLATAVLLVEVVRADPDIRPAEKKAVLATLRTRFALADDTSWPGWWNWRSRRLKRPTTTTASPPA
ncbi:TerB family tellurite resistance protein [Polaromonas sp. UC242_47]|uniref:tellurite resistance TerB family protein n=1 Tax=Polaromonas sp. UC242_47 TaxID=3374626 RepID=UPI0037BB9651